MDTSSGRISTVLVPSSQGPEPLSERPTKRRRTTQILADSDDESGSQASEASVALPSHNGEGFIDVDDAFAENENRSKYEQFLHEPAYAESQTNIFVTQVDQPWSSPTRIRGPRWRKKTPTPSPSPSPESIPTIRQLQGAKSVVNDIVIADDFDDDEIEALMSQDFELATNLQQQFDDAPSAAFQQQPQQNKNMRQTTLFGTQTTQREPRRRPGVAQTHNWPLSERNEPPTHHRIDEKAMEKWIFPMNLGKMRDYQYNIVHKALFNNLLVALPTGLGKTFIAATVMMNWYRWTKDAQIVFMAPTKPLVQQQTEACYHIAGIPRSDTILMTGETPSTARAEEWQAKRVFFMTPQTMINDLKTGIADPKKIVLVVVDEAHRATGNYAYVEVVRFLRRFNPTFRVLALTATPGASVEAVQKVIDGLDIARTEIRTEDSLDIRGFVKDRNTDLEIFDYSEEIEMCIDLFSKAVKPVMDKLCSQNAFWGKDPTKITMYGLIQARKGWMASEAGRKANPGVKGMINHCFIPMITLAYNLELLKFHGIGPFYQKMKAFQEDTGHAKYAKLIIESAHFSMLMSRMRAWIQSDDFVGHPKLSYLSSVILNHFLDAGNGEGRAAGYSPAETRIMIFTHWRLSAEEICRVLNKHKPIVRPHVFVGQADSKDSAGMDQKTQNKIITEFKDGIYNTLVCTSIGEEGLDIGEVDLIVCYDCSKSPIRMLQRMGRTGRKRTGNVTMLLMREKEEKDYYQAKDNYVKMQELIESGKSFQYHEDRSPRMVPKGITPVVSKEHIEIPIENTQHCTAPEPKKTRGKGKKKPPKRFNMPDGVETGFQFLGGKKDRPQPAVKEKPKKRTFLDEDDAGTPPDVEVFLTAKQEAELEDRYASVPTATQGEDQFIQLIDVANQPQKLRSLAKTKLVSHSRRTQNVVKAFKLARKSGRYDRRPLEPTEEELDMLHPETASKADAPFYVSQQDVIASQAEDLEDLDVLLKRPVSISKSTKPQSRSKRKVVSDDDDDD